MLFYIFHKTNFSIGCIFMNPEDEFVCKFGASFEQGLIILFSLAVLMNDCGIFERIQDPEVQKSALEALNQSVLEVLEPISSGTDTASAAEALIISP